MGRLLRTTARKRGRVLGGAEQVVQGCVDDGAPREGRVQLRAADERGGHVHVVRRAPRPLAGLKRTSKIKLRVCGVHALRRCARHRAELSAGKKSEEDWRLAAGFPPLPPWCQRWC